MNRDERQAAVFGWARATFGENSITLKERARRFLEEALELAQAAGVSEYEVADVADHVYLKLAGNVAQEAGGVGITLLAFCGAAGVSAEAEELREWERVQAIDPDHFRRRHNAKADAGVAVRGTEPTEPTVSIDDLIERSSLGTPEAKAIRAAADPVAVQRVMDRLAELEAAPLIHTCIVGVPSGTIPEPCPACQAAFTGGARVDRIATLRSSVLPSEPIDPRPICIRCGKRWVPSEAVDATVVPCHGCEEELGGDFDRWVGARLRTGAKS